MSTHRNIDRICLAVIAAALVITVLFMNGENLGITVLHDGDTEACLLYTSDAADD